MNAASAPLVALDAQVNGATLTPSFAIGGWAIDRGAAVGTGVDLVTASATVVATGAVTPLGTTTYGGARPDIGSLYGSQFTPSGYG